MILHQCLFRKTKISDLEECKKEDPKEERLKELQDVMRIRYITYRVFRKKISMKFSFEEVMRIGFPKSLIYITHLSIGTLVPLCSVSRSVTSAAWHQ